MNKKQHRVFASACWVGLGMALRLEPGEIIIGVIPAAIFSAGRTSPDIDNYGFWKRFIWNRWTQRFSFRLVDNVLGHRRLTHWWGIPALAAIAAFILSAPWVIWAAIFGWFTHLVGDYFFGKGGGNIPRGVPMMPWWEHRGLGFKSGGVENQMFLAALVAEMVFIVGLTVFG